MMFHVGQKVVCVDANNGGRAGSFAFGSGYDHGLRSQAVYTVSNVYAQEGYTFLDLAECPRGGWHSVRFRPVAETDISIFTEMLLQRAFARTRKRVTASRL